MKKYILIAGVNGAGKSTLYHILPDMQGMARINTDEILKQFGGNWTDPDDVVRAGKIAVKKIEEYFQTEESFNQETTLCGRTVFRNIRKAREKGYFIEVHYVGVDSADIAKKRVQHRVSNGGHGIPERDIERRYEESLKNMKELIHEVDLILFYDNSEYVEQIAICKQGEFTFMKESIPLWLKRITECV